MKKCRALIVLALTIGMAMPASAGVGDPESIIYRFPGVLDNAAVLGGGSPVTIVATVFHCTNFSGVTETLRFVTRRNDTTLTSNRTVNIAHLATVTVGTSPNDAYTLQLDLLTGHLQGTTAIAATSTNIICTAEKIDVANSRPVGISLRGIRFSPVPGSQE